MAIADRQARDRAARRRLITAAARAVAEREGWGAVTSRRLSAEIEYSQPVLYKHFASIEDIVDAVALEGFAELAEALASARRGGEPHEALTRVAHAYAVFATENPALYDAMFSRPSRLHFAVEDTPAEMSAGFVELREAAAEIAGGRDLDTLTEVLWAGLHGLTTLSHGHRLRPGLDASRIELFVDEFLGRSPSRRRE
jgi:AcrR family transcriptional regulator